jgi:beta-lactamase regulating signal transducer with metallopeptidase domain
MSKRKHESIRSNPSADALLFKQRKSNAFEEEADTSALPKEEEKRRREDYGRELVFKQKAAKRETIKSKLVRTEKALKMAQTASADVQQQHKQQQQQDNAIKKAVDEAIAAKVTIIEQMELDAQAERQKAAEE